MFYYNFSKAVHHKKIEKERRLTYAKRFYEEAYRFIEKKFGSEFIVNVKPAEKAKQTTDEFIKALITKECLALEAECA